MRCFGGFRSSRRYHPNQKNEIYNLGVVPEPPELKKLRKNRKYFKNTFRGESDRWPCTCMPGGGGRRCSKMLKCKWTPTCIWGGGRGVRHPCKKTCILQIKDSSPGLKSRKNHDLSVEKSFKIFQKNCLDFSTPGPKSLNNHDFPVENLSFFFRKIV